MRRKNPVKLLIEEGIMLDDIKPPPKKPNPEEKRKVTPLQRFLTSVDLEEIFDFLQSIDVKWTCRRMGPRNHKMEIWSEGGFRCDGQSESPKGAITNALSKFFINETRDYHELERTK